MENKILKPIVKLNSEMFIDSNGNLTQDDKSGGHKLNDIIDVIRGDSLESVLHLIGHKLSTLKANEKHSDYKFTAINCNNDKVVCNEYILSGFAEDINRLLPFRDPNAFLVHFQNRFYGIVVSSECHYICGHIKQVVSSDGEVNAVIIGKTTKTMAINDLNIEQFLKNKARIFQVTKQGFLFSRPRDNENKWGFMKNTIDLDLALAINGSYLIITDGEEVIHTYWKRKDENAKTHALNQIEDKVTQLEIKDRLLISEAAFLMFKTQQLIWGNADTIQ